ncbi:MAG: hypothetical protein VZR53_13750 [Prevotella sp.]|nr:hypothetical protein [Prevotella sp.]
MSDIFTAINSTKNGTFTRINYVSYPKVRAEFKGYTVEKETETTTRLGCKYSNLSAVKAKGGVVGRPDYAEPIDNTNRIYRNKKNGELYLQLEPIHDNTNTVVKYTVIDMDGKRNEITKDVARQYCVASAFSGGRPDVIRVKVNNIRRINNITVDKIAQ